MFKFLKDKLKSFFKGSEEKLEKADEEGKELEVPVPSEEEKTPDKTEEKTGESKEKPEEKQQEEEKKIEIKESKEQKAEIKESVYSSDIEIEFSEKKEEIKVSGPSVSEEVKQEKSEKEGFFSKLKRRFESFRLSEQSFDEIWKDLELLLLQSNVAMSVIKQIKKSLGGELIGKEIKKAEIEDTIKTALRNAISKILLEPFDIVEMIKSERGIGKPFVIVFFGINGSGKTTTIAKLANLLLKSELTCVLSASDTFRAASIEQLQKHASKLDIKLIKHEYGSDAAAVAYDAIQYAKANSIDAVLVDTAGRMHTQGNLMKEMEKICRVAKPNLRIFIGEATVGNDMVEQAKKFSDEIGIDGIILTKSDVDEKGGAAISASYITKKPILFLGTGQEYSNLDKFNSEKFLDGIGL